MFSTKYSENLFTRRHDSSCGSCGYPVRRFSPESCLRSYSSNIWRYSKVCCKRDVGERHRIVNAELTFFYDFQSVVWFVLRDSAQIRFYCGIERTGVQTALVRLHLAALGMFRMSRRSH